ncbi:MAG: formimidoylglutamase [Nitrospinales bacterium]
MGDKRLGDIIRQGEKGRVVLLGFPHDEGVALNGGRPGACAGPERFRQRLRRFGAVDNPQMGIDLTDFPIADAGDIPAHYGLKEAHSALTRRTEAALKGGGIPFIVGGGNDQSYPNASALLNQVPRHKAGVVNIDAHLDVRPLEQGQAHSGSPFRLLLEDSRFDGRNFVEFAAQGNQCSQEHADYIRNKNGTILWLDEVQEKGSIGVFRKILGRLAWSSRSVFVSFDLDSIAGAEAPGVSCPGIVGLTAKEALSIAYMAGSHPSVRLFDLSEFNPAIEEERTGRLAAGIFYYFCLGVASRKHEPA